MSHWRWRFERKVEDAWVGVFWRRDVGTSDDGIISYRYLDIWICIVPCLPLHLTRTRVAL